MRAALAAVLLICPACDRPDATGAAPEVDPADLPTTAADPAETAEPRPASLATADLEPLPPRPTPRTYPPMRLNPPQPEIDRLPWMVVGETLRDGSTLPTRTRAVDAPPLEGVIPWHEARLYIGREATIEGRIRDTGRSGSGRIHFLNFIPDDRDAFYLAVFAEAFDGLGGDPAADLADQIVQVTGRITLHRGRPQIEVRDAAQIDVLDAPTIGPTVEGENGGALEDLPTTEDGTPIVPWDQAHRMRGRIVAAEGKVRATKNIGNLCFVNFTDERDERLYVVIFSEAFEGFGGEPESRLLNQTIRVTGRVVDHRGRPQIQVRDTDQIRILED